MKFLSEMISKKKHRDTEAVSDDAETVEGQAGAETGSVIPYPALGEKPEADEATGFESNDANYEWDIAKMDLTPDPSPKEDEEPVASFDDAFADDSDGFDDEDDYEASLLAEDEDEDEDEQAVADMTDQSDDGFEDASTFAADAEDDDGDATMKEEESADDQDAAAFMESAEPSSALLEDEDEDDSSDNDATEAALSAALLRLREAKAARSQPKTEVEAKPAPSSPAATSFIARKIQEMQQSSGDDHAIAASAETAGDDDAEDMATGHAETEEPPVGETSPLAALRAMRQDTLDGDDDESDASMEDAHEDEPEMAASNDAFWGEAEDLDEDDDFLAGDDEEVTADSDSDAEMPHDENADDDVAAEAEAFDAEPESTAAEIVEEPEVAEVIEDVLDELPDTENEAPDVVEDEEDAPMEAVLPEPEAEADPDPIQVPMQEAEAQEPDTMSDADIPPAMPRRTGRVKTRLLGFQRPEDVATDPISAAQSRTDVPEFPVGWLVVVKGPGRGASFTLEAGASKIGRGEDQAVRLDFGDTSISRDNHAVVAYDDELKRFYIGHGGKANLVRLNDMPVLSTEPLVDSDLIRIGETTLKFVALCNDEFSWTEGPFAEPSHAAE